MFYPNIIHSCYALVNYIWIKHLLLILYFYNNIQWTMTILFNFFAISLCARKIWKRRKTPWGNPVKLQYLQGGGSTFIQKLSWMSRITLKTRPYPEIATHAFSAIYGWFQRSPPGGANVTFTFSSSLSLFLPQEGLNHWKNSVASLLENLYLSVSIERIHHRRLASKECRPWPLFIIYPPASLRS